MLGLYLLTLGWLTLFKLSYDIPAVLTGYQSRSVNLIPFAGLEHTGLGETMSNVVTFVPFGLLLGMNFKRTAGWRLTGLVLIFSLAVETVQFVLAIGATDATDVVANTLGGCTGLVLYRLAGKVIPATALDRIISVVGLAMFVAFILLRLLVFKVRY